MITIQTGMLITLGFLAACLLGLLVAPALWSRAARLTAKRIRDTVPLSEMEIAADRDRIRAEYAIKMHKLESLVEQVKLAGARQQIEINRRDARVNMLEADLERLRASYEEALNARRVLEQAVAERLPRVEGRLGEAKNSRFARDNADLDLALRTELESLKAKAEEQAQLIDRLQESSKRASLSAVSSGSGASEDNAAVSAGEIRGASAQVGQLEHDQQIAALRARNEDQAAEIARLKAALAVFEREGEGDGKSLKRESRTALEARIQSLEAQVTRQAETVRTLRDELSLANERLARPETQMPSEKQRADRGAGGVPQRPRSTAAARLTLADRIAQARSSAAGAVDGAAAAASDSIEPASDPTADQSLGGKSRGSDDVPTVAETAPAGALAASPIDSREAALTDGPLQSGKHREKAPAASASSRPRLLDRLAGLSRTS